MVDQLSDGARRLASSAMLASRSVSVTIERIASAMASGSACGTTIPAPLLEQLDRVRERRRDDGTTRRDRVDEHPGRHLIE